MIGPGALADALAGLPVRISEVRVQTGGVWLADYAGAPPREPRPTSVVRVSGGGHSGCGENVAFSAEEHRQFAARGDALLSQRRPGGVGARADGHVGGVVGDLAAELMGSGGCLYERAALEAAVIDLGMRQAGVTLSDLTGVTTAPLRFVVSFAACADPAEQVRRLRADGCAEDLKIDVDPSWQPATCAELARQSGIAILDFKGRGDAAWAQSLAKLFPGTIFEDPPPGFQARPALTAAPAVSVSRDAPLADAPAVAAALARGEAVNLKAPRMGGPLELLRGLDHATSAANGLAAAEVTVYFGGMFEIGVGRLQARRLAALYCGGAPNDLASNRRSLMVEPPGAADGNAPWPPIVLPAKSPLTVRLDGPGFSGADVSVC